MDDLLREFRIIDNMLTDILPMRVSKYEKNYQKNMSNVKFYLNLRYNITKIISFSF